MGIVDRLLGRQSEERAVGGMWNVEVDAAGTSLNEKNATNIGALYASVMLYANTVASMPVGVFIRDGGVRRPVTRPRWLDNPVPNNPNYTRFDLMHRTVSSLLIDGNSFLMILRGENGEIVEVRLLDPRKVTILRTETGAPIYRVKTTAGSVDLTADDIVHITLFGVGEDLRGLSPVEHHKTTLGLAKATTEYAAKFFEQGASVSGLVTVPGELTADQAESLRASFGRRHEGLRNMHKIAVLTGGASYESMGFNPSDLAIVENMEAGTQAIARLYGIPLHLLQLPGANSSYNSLEIVSREWLMLGLGSLIARLEAGLQRLIVGDTTFIKFNVDSILRPLTKERYESYRIGLNEGGFLTLNEVRAMEDRPPLGPEGDVFRQPLNIGIVGEEPQA
jgi:HK97 family phage portal protein